MEFDVFQRSLFHSDTPHAYFEEFYITNTARRIMMFHLKCVWVWTDSQHIASKKFDFWQGTSKPPRDHDQQYLAIHIYIYIQYTLYIYMYIYIYAYTFIHIHI